MDSKAAAAAAARSLLTADLALLVELLNDLTHTLSLTGRGRRARRLWLKTEAGFRMGLQGSSDDQDATCSDLRQESDSSLVTSALDTTLPSLLWTIKKWNRCGKSVRIRHRQTLVISGEISFFQINPIVQLPDICQDSEVQIFSRGGYSQQMDIQSNHWLLSKVGTADLGRPDPGLNSDGTYSSFEREKRESVLLLPKWLLGFLIVKMYL